MNQEQQIKALAELDGWKFDGLDFANREQYSQCGLTRRLCDLPDYLTSYDAIIPLIQKQDLIIGKHFMQVLHKFVPGSGEHHVKDFYLFLCSPSQLCEALLRATGKWTE